MGFLFKTLLFLGVVLLLVSRDAERRSAPPERAAAARPSVAASPKPRPAQVESATSPIAAARGALSDLADEAAGKIAEMARDHCMAHPMECLRAAEKIGRATAVEPPKRPAGLGAAP